VLRVNCVQTERVPSVILHCWLNDRKGILTCALKPLWLGVAVKVCETEWGTVHKLHCVAPFEELWSVL